MGHTVDQNEKQKELVRALLFLTSELELSPRGAQVMEKLGAQMKCYLHKITEEHEEKVTTF